MARNGRRRRNETRDQAVPTGVTDPATPEPLTKVLIADIVLRGAGMLLRQRVEKGMLTRSLDDEKARRLVEQRGLLTTLALYGASRLATRSPVGLALVAGGLAAKLFYDRGRKLEARRKADAIAPPGTDG